MKKLQAPIWTKKLKISEWTSEYVSVSKLLSHLKRIGGSESSRALYCYTLYKFCRFVGREKSVFIVWPDDLVRLGKDELESLVQSFGDLWKNPRTANTNIQVVKTFFRYNGFKRERELDVESYSLRGFNGRLREYIPSLAEALRMANVAGSLKNRAIILMLLSTGLRNSTLRAIRFGEIRRELASGIENLHIRVHSGMKEVVPNACKGNIEYSAFTSPAASEALQLYVKERLRKFGKIDDEEPLFISEPGRLRRLQRISKPLSSREVQFIVKKAARRAGIEKWKDVMPHSLRKTFATWILCAPLRDGGRLDLKTQEVLMGHKLSGSMNTYYDRSKIDSLRKEYSKLTFTPKDRELTEILKTFKDLNRALVNNASLTSAEKQGSNFAKPELLTKAVVAIEDILHDKRFSDISKTKPPALQDPSISDHIHQDTSKQTFSDNEQSVNTRDLIGFNEVRIPRSEIHQRKGELATASPKKSEQTALSLFL